MNRHQTPLLFVQDVSGFMVGPDAEHSGIIRAGAEFVEAMATATVPKLVLTLNHASGAGYYAMAGQGFDPDFILSLPTGRMGVMEGRVRSWHSSAASSTSSRPKARSRTRTSRPRWTRCGPSTSGSSTPASPRHGASWTRVVLPDELRPALGLLLRAALQNPGPHIGAFHIPEGAR